MRIRSRAEIEGCLQRLEALLPTLKKQGQMIAVSNQITALRWVLRREDPFSGFMGEES